MNPEGSLQAVWMLPCATCLSSFSRVVFEHFCDSVEAYSFYVESIGLLKSKSITPLIFFFFLSCLADPLVVLSPHVQMERNQVGFMFSLSWVLH